MIRKVVALLVLIPSLAFAKAPDAPTDVASDMTPNWTYDATFPFRVYDWNYGDWRTEVAIGNMMVDMDWYDGPSEEVGYAKGQKCSDGPEDSGKMYCAISAGENWPILVELDYSTGVSRLVLDQFGTVEGDSTEAMAGYPIYNSYDDAVYLIGKGFCVRKLVDDGDGTHSVTLFSGDCATPGQVDGTSSTSRYGYILGAATDGAGNIWIAESYSGNPYIRKIDTNGAATTINDATRDDSGSVLFSILNSPYTMIVMSPGRDSTNVHLADSWTGAGVGWSSQRINTSTHVMTRVAGVDFSSSGDDTYGRSAGREKDGPALTHTYLQASGQGSIYSPFYDSIILQGQDQDTIQRYSYNTDWVAVINVESRPWHTVDSYTDEELYDAPIPSEDDVINPTTIHQIHGADRYGGIYYTPAKSVRKTYRMYNPTLGGLALGDIE